ncbi:MAG: PTS sugar transporter subunit IIC, partial [Clostridia bacterium]|nr:PTS sugar transporter subunit IIC [Clostridia bacterium]
MAILKGTGLLIVALAAFSLFSFKAPKGQKAMAGLAGAAVASFLVEAIYKYIFGSFLGISFLGEVGMTAGDLSGTAAAALVAIAMGVQPVYALAAGLPLAGMGILPGFIIGYLVGLIAPKLDEKLPSGINLIATVLVLAPLGRFIAQLVTPGVDLALAQIGNVILAAADQSPLLMGFLLGGLIKIICSSPLSSMALTAMLGLTGLPMGIAAVACVGGSFTNGIVFYRLKLGHKGNIMGVMIEPLTQTEIITTNPIPVYGSNFLGGGLAGMAAAALGIVNNAPGTAAPIPGLLAPFAFNDPWTVTQALVLAVLGGILGGVV